MFAAKHSFSLVFRKAVLRLEITFQDKLLRFTAGAAAAFSAEDDVADHHFAVRLMYIWEGFEVSCGSGRGTWVTLFASYYYSNIVSVHVMLSVACCPVFVPLIVDDCFDLSQVC